MCRRTRPDGNRRTAAKDTRFGGTDRQPWYAAGRLADSCGMLQEWR